MQFKMKALGLADVVLEIKVVKHFEGITLTQSYYVEKVLKKFKHLMI